MLQCGTVYLTFSEHLAKQEYQTLNLVFLPLLLETKCGSNSQNAKQPSHIINNQGNAGANRQ